MDNEAQHAEPEPRRRWHALTTDDTVEQLQTSAQGLTRKEAARRLEEYGPNALPEEEPPSGLRIFLQQFANPLIYILVVAAGITLALGEWLDTILISLALLLNAVIGFVQERKASHAVRALMQLIVPHAHVIREGHEMEIDAADVVPGDLVLLEPGSRVPADLRLSEVNEAKVDESALTGESLPASKTLDAVDEGASLGDRSSMAFTGTIMTSGRARGYAVETGQHTELGRIADLVSAEEAADAPLAGRMAELARLIGVSVLIAAAITFVSGVALGESVSQMFRVAVAMSVSAIPEALPVAATVTLAIGVSRMARRNAVLRRLAALETLGSTTVIGSDKTGTLTENRMTVQLIRTAQERLPLDDSDPEATAADPATAEMSTRLDPSLNEALRRTIEASVFSNEADLGDGESFDEIGDPTETALLRAAISCGVNPGDLRHDHEVLGEIPFESERRYAASIRHIDGHRAVYAKGAPERILAMSSEALATDGSLIPLDPEQLSDTAAELAADGLRVLAMAYRPLDDSDELPTPDDEPEGLIFAGLAGMMDPPRDGVREAIEACHDAGIGVIMITGDHALTARAIATELGIVDDRDARTITGEAMSEIGDSELQQLVQEVAVFARVSPNDKLRIVRALQRLEHTVAVTGDGVNDAPALRAAAIGVAMGQDGTDVAREASEMVLSDDNFVSIVAAVEEGRIAFSNIRKVAFFLISTAAAETLAIMLTVWLGWPLILIPAQILWLNLVTNGVQDLALAFEPGSPDVLKREPRPAREGVLSRLMLERIAIVAVVMAAGALYMFRWELDRGASVVTAQTVALTTLVVFNIFQAGNARSENQSLFRLNPLSNPFLFWATIGAIALHVGALYLPPMQYILGVEPISGEAWLRAIIVGISILVTVEIHKAIRRRWPMPGSAVRTDA